MQLTKQPTKLKVIVDGTDSTPPATTAAAPQPRPGDGVCCSRMHYSWQSPPPITRCHSPADPTGRPLFCSVKPSYLALSSDRGQDKTGRKEGRKMVHKEQRISRQSSVLNEAWPDAGKGPGSERGICEGHLQRQMKPSQRLL